MNSLLRLLFAVLLFSAFTTLTTGQQETPDTGKALKYHSALKNQPSPGYLYDRFYNEWLDAATISELEEFLTDQVQQSKSTADRLLLAFFHIRQGNDVDAIQQFRAALADDPTSAATWYEKAVVESRNLDYETAIADLEKAAAANPNDELAIRIGKLRGRLHVRNRQNDQAAAVWNELLQQRADDLALLEDMIDLHLEESLFDRAAELANQLIERTEDPYQRVIHTLRKGDVLQQAGKRNQALEVYAETLDKVGTDSWLEREIIGQIEQLFRREDNLSGLNEHYAKLIKEDPRRIALLKGQSSLLMELGMADEAVQAFQKIIGLTPGDRDNRQSFIEMLARADRIDDAIKQTDSLIEQFPADAESRIQLAQLYHQHEKPDEAAAAIEAWLKASDETEYAILRAARLYETFNQLDKAEQTHARAAESFRDSQTAQEAYAAILFKRDRRDEALEIWQKLADGADRSQVVRVARILTSRQLHDPAFELLYERFDEFQADGIYLGALCSAAIAVEKYEQALPWVLRRVRIAETTGDLEQAITQAARVIDKSKKLESEIARLQSKNDRSAASTALLSELLEISGQFNAADELLAVSAGSAATADDKSELRRIVNQQVRLAMKRQDWPRAADMTLQLVQLPGGRNAVNLQRLVELLNRTGQSDQALKFIEQWKQVSPGSLVPWLQQSTIHAREGRPEEAANVLRRAMRKFPDDQDLAAQLAQRFIENGQHRDAERIYWQQFEQASQLTDKLRWSEQLARLAERIGESATLIKQLGERRDNNPQSIEPLLALAQAHRIFDDYEERRRALLKATRLQPDNLQLLLEVAQLEETQGEWQKAIETLKRAEKVDKTNGAKQRIARLHLQYDEPEKGFSILLELAGGGNADARSIEKICDAIIATGDWEQARDFLIPHLARFPDDYRLRYQFAIALEEAGQFEAATGAFLEVLDANTELTGLPKHSGSKRMRSSFNLYAEVLPPSAVELMMLTSMNYSAYSHRQNYRQYGGYSQAGSSIVQLPSDLEIARTLAICHLTTIAESADDETRDSLAEELKRRSINNAELIVNIGTGLSNQNRLAGLLEDFPDNEALLATTMLQSAQRTNIEADALVRGWEKFHADYPELGLIAAIGASSQDEKHGELVNRSLDELANVESPTEYLVSMLANALMRQSRNRGASDGLPRETVSRINKKMVELYPKITNRSGTGQWAFSLIANNLLRESSPEPYVNFMELEVQRARGDRASINAASMYSRRYGSRGNLIRPLPFPPSNWSSFPRHVASAIRINQTNPDPYANYYYFGDEEAEADDPEAWAKKLAESTDQVADPILKAMLQMKAVAARVVEEDDPSLFDPARKTLDSEMKSDQPDVDAWLLAASLAIKQERFVEAAELLEKARNLPMVRLLREQIDGALVALAIGTSIEADSDEAKPVIASARAAALRLNRLRLSANQRAELLDAFERLELKEEAEKLESRIASMPTGPSGSGYGPSASRTPSSRIERLIDSGKREAAARLLAQDFRSVALRESTLGQMNQDPYELKEFLTDSKSMSIEKEVLEQLDHGESASKNQQVVYAVTLDFLGKREEAIERYRKLLEADAKLDGVRLRLMRLLIEEDENLFVEHLNQIRPRMLDQATSQIVNWHSYETPIERRFAVMRQASRYIEQLDDVQNVDLSWVGQLHRQLGDELYQTSGPQLSSLFQKPEDDSSAGLSWSRREKQIKLDKKRVELFVQLSRQMLGVPQLARDGFTRLQAISQTGRIESSDDFVELAKRAILTHQPHKPKPGGNAHYQRQAVTYFNTGFASLKKSFVPQQTPEEFLAREAGLNNRPTPEQLQQFVAEVKAAGKKESAENIEQILNLYTCPEAEFPKLVAERLKQNRRGMRQQTDSKSLKKMVEIWVDRELEISLTDLLMKELSNSGPQLMYSNNVSWLATYLATLAKRQPDKVRNFLLEYSESLLGPRSKQRELAAKAVKLAKKSQQVSFARSTDLMVYLNLLKQLTNRRELVIPVLDELEFLSVDGVLNDVSSQIRYRFFGNSKAEHLEALDAIEDSPLLADLDQFNPYMIKSDGSTAWSDMLDQRIGARDFRAAVKEKMETISKTRGLRFGEQALLELVESNSSFNVRGLELIGENLETWDQLSRKRKLAITNFVRKMGPGSGRLLADGIKLSENAAAVRKSMDALLNENATGDLEKLADAKRAEDLGIKQHRLDEWAKDLILRIDVSDRQEVVDSFFKMLELQDRALRRNRSSYYSHVPLSDRLFGNLLKSNPEYETLGIVLDLLSEKRKSIPQFGEQAQAELNEFLARELKQLTKEEKTGSKNAKKNRLATLQRLLDKTGAQIGDRDISVLVPTLSERIAGSKFDEEQLREWAGLVTESNRFPNIARGFATAATMAAELPKVIVLDTEEAAPAEKMPVRNSEPAGYQQQLLDVVRDQDRSVAWRMPIASFLLLRDQTLPIDGFQDCLKLFIERMNDGAQVDYDTISAINLVFAKHGAEEAWRESGKAWAKAWKKRFLAGRGGTWMRPENLDSAIRMMARLDEKSTVNQIARAYENNVYHRQVLKTFIETGFDDLARKTLLDRWRDSGTQAERAGNGRFTRQFEAKLPGFVAQFENEPLQFLTETWFAIMADPTGDDWKPDVDRATRLNRLAERFSDIEFDSRNHRELALLLLQDAEQAAEILLPAFEQATERIDVANIYDENSYSGRSYRNGELFMAYTQLALKTGNSGPFEKMVGALNENQEARVDFSYVHRREHSQYSLAESVLEFFNSASPESVQRILPALQSIAVRDHQFNSEWMAPLLVGHLATGQLEKFSQWVKNENEVQQGSDDQQESDEDEPPFTINLDQVWKPIAGWLRREQADAARKLDVVRQVWSLSSEDHYRIGSGHFLTGNQLACSRCSQRKMGLDALVESKLLTEAELAEHGPELAGIEHVDGEVWRQVSVYQLKQKQVAAAADSLKKSLDAIEKKEGEEAEEFEQAKSNRLVEYAFVLSQLDRSGEIEAILEDVDPSLLLGDNEQKFSDLSDNLGEDE